LNEMPHVLHGLMHRCHPSRNRRYGTPAGTVYPVAEALVDKSEHGI
jgi:hypothetical protein